MFFVCMFNRIFLYLYSYGFWVIWIKIYFCIIDVICGIYLYRISEKLKRLNKKDDKFKKILKDLCVKNFYIIMVSEDVIFIWGSFHRFN